MSKSKRQRGIFGKGSKAKASRGGSRGFVRAPKVRQFEQLEPRQMLAAEVITGAQAKYDALVRPVELAFQHASDLSQYSSQQINNATRWVVHTGASITPGNFSAQVGVPLQGTYSHIDNTFFADATNTSSSQIIASLSNNPNVQYFYPEVTTSIQDPRLAFVNDPLTRDHQWWVRNTGQEISQADVLNNFAAWGEDINIEGAWDITTGEGATIAIVDDGFFFGHPELSENYAPELSYDFSGRDENPSPDTTTGPLGDYHGTAVGGIVGAKGNNGKGVTGVAYDATLAGIRLFGGILTLGATFTDEAIAEALRLHGDVIDVYNNSWGLDNGVRQITAAGPFHTQALIDSALLSKEGRGTVHVIASGNDAGQPLFDNSNYASFQNTIYGVTVSGFRHDGVSAEYAEGGANIFVTAPTGDAGSGITTTDLSGDLGYNVEGFTDDNIGRDFLEDTDYTSRFNGTSAAAPVVSGVVGLMFAAARDNGIELTLRDVQHILARSSRRISPEDIGWATNADPLFVDPQVNDTGIPIGAEDPNYIGGGSAIPWMFDAESGTIVSDVGRQFTLATNGAGYYVHDSLDYGYGHGAIDATLAVELASNWVSVGKHDITEVVSVRQIYPGPAGVIPAAEVVELESGREITIPGGVGGESGFEEFFELWLEPPADPPEDPPEDPPRNTRGTSIPIPGPQGMAIEWVEVTVNFDTMPATASDNVKMTLVSPDGTQSELTNYIKGNNRPAITAVDGSFEWTFTTNRHWGERGEGVGRINPLDGSIIESSGQWQLVIENWSGDPLHLNSTEIDFHGTNTPSDFFGNSGRIQGTVGVEIDNDGTFNTSGIFAEEVEVESMTTGGALTETSILSFLDPDYEPMASGVTVYVDLTPDDGPNADGSGRNEFDPYFVTGADGNFYFDLPWGTYDVHFELPEGMTSVGPESYQYVLGPEIPGDPASVVNFHHGADFLFEPAAVHFEGTVFADFDGDGTQQSSNNGLAGFLVYIDLVENGRLDFVDINANGFFDEADTALEPFVATGADGNFSLTIDNSLNSIENPFGESITFNDRYVGPGRYAVLVNTPDAWSSTSLDVNVLDDPFFLGHVAPGETVSGIEFGFTFDGGGVNGIFAGDTFHDLNSNGQKNANDPAISGVTVFIDLNGNRIHDATSDPLTNEPAFVTGEGGQFVFEIGPGTYDIVAMGAPGFEVTKPFGGVYQNVTIEAGEIIAGGLVDFGFRETETSAPARDYGDLDAPFRTTAASGGASHGIFAGYHLGAGVSEETDGQPDTGAAADTFDDGVVFLDPIVAGQTVRVDVTASTNVLFLQGWIDFDNNGEFSGEEEHIAFLDAAGVPLAFSKQARLDAGLNQLSFVVPNEVMGTSIAARFRYGEGGTAQYNQPDGPAILGEVEDYLLPATISTSFIQPVMGDFDGSNVVDGGDYLVWKQTLGSNLDLRADANANGVVDMGDFAMWRDNLGAVASASLNFAPGAALTTASEEQPSSIGFVTVAGGDLASYQLGGSQSESSTLFGDSPATPSASAIDLALDAVYAEEEEELDEFEVAASSSDSDAQALALALEDELEAV